MLVLIDFRLFQKHVKQVIDGVSFYFGTTICGGGFFILT